VSWLGVGVGVGVGGTSCVSCVYLAFQRPCPTPCLQQHMAIGAGFAVYRLVHFGGCKRPCNLWGMGYGRDVRDEGVYETYAQLGAKVIIACQVMFLRFCRVGVL
jgi:hypothetical protein